MIFFDIDGTLLDHDAAERHAALKFAHNQNLTITSEDSFVFHWHVVSERHMDRYLLGEISFEDQRHFRLQEILGRELDPVEAASIFSTYLEAYESSWCLYEDVLPCVKSLSQPLGIITNGNRHQQIRKLRRTGIAKYFSTIVVSEDIGVSKPEAEIFHAACSLATVKPADCIYVGDKLSTDAIGAMHSGWQGIWLNRFDSIDSVPPDVIVISKLSDLKV